MKPTVNTLLDTIQELSLESKADATITIKVSHLNQLRMEIIALNTKNASLVKANNQLSDSVKLAKDRIHDLNQSMIEAVYGQKNFETILTKRLFDTIG